VIFRAFYYSFFVLLPDVNNEHRWASDTPQSEEMENQLRWIHPLVCFVKGI